MKRRNGCHGKVAHNTRLDAIAAMRRMRIATLNVYHCGICQMWHLGNSRSPSRIQDRFDQLLGKKR